MKSLSEIYKSLPHHHPEMMGCGDKGTTHSYIAYYEELLKPYREKFTDVLEIGIAPGALSLRMWEQYFTKANIYGIDIQEWDDNITKYNNDRVNISIGDATKKEDIDRLYLHHNFDFILDDGSHTLEHQLLSFEYLFPKVKVGGLYLIEDVQNFHEPAVANIFKKLHSDVDIVDRRHIKNRYDDVIILIRKDK